MLPRDIGDFSTKLKAFPKVLLVIVLMNLDF